MTKEILKSDAPALGCLIGTAYQTLLGQLASALKEAGLDITASEYIALRAIYGSDGMQQCEIADMLGKDKSAVCRCIAGLEKKGLAMTEPVSHKCRRVYITDKGRQLKPRIMEVAATRHKALTDMTTPEELEIFTNILERIITNNQK